MKRPVQQAAPTAITHHTDFRACLVGVSILIKFDSVFRTASLIGENLFISVDSNISPDGGVFVLVGSSGEEEDSLEPRWFKEIKQVLRCGSLALYSFMPKEDWRMSVNARVCKNVQDGMTVFKLGAGTLLTSGVVQDSKVDGDTFEVVSNLLAPFAFSADIGALVFTIDKVVVGAIKEVRHRFVDKKVFMRVFVQRIPSEMLEKINTLQTPV